MNEKKMLSAILAVVILSTALVSCSEKTVDTDTESVGAADGVKETEIEETETETEKANKDGVRLFCAFNLLRC